jgi:hypothetical protein
LGLRQNKSESKSKSLSSWYLLCFVVMVVALFHSLRRRLAPGRGRQIIKSLSSRFYIDMETLRKTH